MPSVKVSPVEHSMPNMATMSPAPASMMSSMSLLCMRTSLGTCPHMRSTQIPVDINTSPELSQQPQDTFANGSHAEADRLQSERRHELSQQHYRCVQWSQAG